MVRLDGKVLEGPSGILASPSTTIRIHMEGAALRHMSTGMTRELKMKDSSFMSFEMSNPRTCSLKSPHLVDDPEYIGEYRQMSMKSAFPGAFGNGLYHIVLGVFVCLASFFILLGASLGVFWPIAIAGTIASIAVSYFYARYLQTKALFPQGASMTGSKGDAPLAFWLIPTLIFVACPIIAAVTSNAYIIEITLGSTFSLLAMLSYAKTNRNGLLVLAVLCLAIPVVLAYMGVYQEATDFGVMMTTIPYEGILYVFCGIILMNSAIVPSSRKHDRERLESYLNSDDENKQFSAASFLCSSIDPTFITELLRLAQSENHTVAYTAQVAIGNIWGPKPKGVDDEIPLSLNPNFPQEYREQAQEQMKMHQRAIRDRWLKHYATIEDQLANMVEEDGQALEDLYALVEGRNVYYKQGRLVAIELLGSMRTPRAYATLMTLLQHRDKKIADAATTSFYGSDSKAVIYLEKFFVSNRSWLRRRAIDSTRNMLYYLLAFDESDAAVAYALLENDIDGLFSTDDTNTFAATITLLIGDNDQSIEILEGYYDNNRPIIKIAAMCTLTYIVPNRAQRYVLPGLDSPYAAVRYASLKCVDALRHPNRDQIYQKMMYDRIPAVGELAQEYLNKYEKETREAKRW